MERNIKKIKNDCPNSDSNWWKMKLVYYLKKVLFFDNQYKNPVTGKMDNTRYLSDAYGYYDSNKTLLFKSYIKKLNE